MLERNIRTDVKKLINEKRALFQFNNIKQRKLKQEILKDNILWKNPEETLNTIRCSKDRFFEFEKDKKSFTPSKITSIKLEREINEEIEFVNLNKNKMIHKSNYNDFPKRPAKLNPLKIIKPQKQIIKVDELLLQSDPLNHLNYTSMNKQQRKDMSKKLLQELNRLNYFQNEIPKIDASTNNKKMMKKKTYKSYHKVLQSKFCTNFCSNILSKQYKSTFMDNNRLNEDVFQITNTTDSFINENSFTKDLKIKRGTYLTTFDALDNNLNSIDFSDNDIHHVNKDIQNKIERIKMSLEISQTNLSIENNPKNQSLTKNRSREKSSSSYLKNDKNPNKDEMNTFSNRKSEKSFLDNYIRLPKILISKISLNNNSSPNSKNDSSYKTNCNMINSIDLFKNFNRTKKERYKLDSLVSKISHKIGNGFPLKKFVSNYDCLLNIYPKKELSKSPYKNLFFESPINK